MAEDVSPKVIVVPISAVVYLRVESTQCRTDYSGCGGAYQCRSGEVDDK